MKGTGKVGTIRGEEAGKGKGAKNRVGSKNNVPRTGEGAVKRKPRTGE